MNVKEVTNWRGHSRRYPEIADGPRFRPLRRQYVGRGDAGGTVRRGDEN
jgi:hypothetical protein